MKKYYLLLVCVLGLGNFFPSNAQVNPQLQWVFNAANTAIWGGTNFGRCIAVDASGNRYVAGYFQGTADFDPSVGTANLTAVGWGDIFIAKYDSNGKYLWAKAFGGGLDDSAISIALNNNGEVYVTGFFSATADFDPSAATANLTSTGNEDIFIAKYDSNGNYIWAKAFGGTNSDYVNSIVVNTDGEVYLTGSFWDTADFDPSVATANLTSAGYDDIFIAKYSSSGSYIWVKGIGGTGFDASNDITLNSSGEVHITGYFSNTVDFDPSASTANLTSAEYSDIFIAKYTNNGSYLWAKAMGGAASDSARSLVVNSIGEVYITGDFSNTVDFDPSAATANLTSAGYNDIFIAKYTNNGSYLWAKAMGGFESDLGFSLAVNSSGEVIITGTFSWTVDFDPSAATSTLTSVNQSRDIFIAKYNSNGGYLWAAGMGGECDESGFSVVVDNNGRISATGDFCGTADFDPSAGTANLTTGGGLNCFVSTYTTSGSYINAFAIGGYSSNSFRGQGNCMAKDAFGNVYVAGIFYGTVDFDPSANTAYWTSAGSRDIFIAKYDSNGNYLWSKAVAGPGFDNVGSLVVNSGGEVYITGYFDQIADFDPSAAVANLNSSGRSDIFIAKYDSNGNYLWAKAIGGPDADLGVHSMAANSSGELYLTGVGGSIGNIDFDPSGATAYLSQTFSFSDIFIAKYDSNGNYLWVKSIVGSRYDRVANLAVNSSGQVYITGSFEETADFDPSANVANLTSVGVFDIFIAKYDSSGNYLWAKAVGGTGNDMVNFIAVNGSGDLYVTGYFASTVDFDPSAATANLTSEGVSNVFLAKYNSSGNYIWAKALGVIDHEFDLDYTRNSLALNSGGEVYMAGMFRGTDDFDPSAAVANFTSVGSDDIFIAKYSSSGNYLWAKAVGGGGQDGATALVVNDKQVYVTGEFEGTCDFEPSNTSGSLTTLGSGDMFLAKYLECTTTTIPTITLTGTTLTSNSTADVYQWIDCNNGNTPVPNATSQSFTPVVSGNYAVVLTMGGCQSTSACQTVLGVREEEMASVKLYPNPTTGNLTISWADSMEDVAIVVTDILGKTIKSMQYKGQQEARFSLDGVASGIYFVRLQNGEKTKQFKLIKK
ncbi:hypothetical protein FEDK69T_23040 [Flavobacterium enshiense DK69]|uniref:Secretion system C-terminal sorting domain-containing protein n=1 Tax=Flavobacterium enshiense DK69 TaxID=1107311 RepID=V6S6Q2_9FLAO|nr:T9SS type A sorting domain-containing protein [Flavobacterium enshiense]ESU22321.1 hypothetical protein FEDK69T_23040 [Flavobacterium enshiense DK69]KGO97325.1 hypothetical protein Q767_01620 [Flavobacterium enshiense DK69]